MTQSSFYPNSPVTYTADSGSFPTFPIQIMKSFNGRVSDVTSQFGDYSFSLISGSVAPSQLPLLTYSFNGRTGIVVPLTGDYSFGQLSGNIDVSQMNSGIAAASDTFWRGDGTWSGITGANGGTVTSVGLTAPSTFTVSGSPVIAAGTLNFSWAPQSAFMVLAGPNSVGTAVPTFRALAATDLPTASIFNWTQTHTWSGTNGSINVTGVGGVSASPPTGNANFWLNNVDTVSNAEVQFQAAGVSKWEMGKDGSGNFFIFDDVAGSNVLSITGNGGAATFSRPVGTLVTIVASLPSAATAGVGARAFVTDATATTFASNVAGTGTNKVPVYSDGTNWKIG